MPTFQLKGTVSVTCAFSLESYVWYFTLNSGTIFHLLIGNHNHFCSVLLCFLYLWSALNVKYLKSKAVLTREQHLSQLSLELTFHTVSPGFHLQQKACYWKDKSQFYNLHENEPPASCLFTPAWSLAVRFIKMCLLYWKGEILDIDANLL